MKITAALIAVLLLSLVVLSGCATQQTSAEDKQLQTEATPEQAASEASTQLVPENSDVEIGEML